MGSTTELRRELKERFFPRALAGGFVLDQSGAPGFWRFLRRAGDGVHLLEVQWEKYGRPRFVINFGQCPLEGLTIDGKRFPPEQVLVGWLPSNGRLQPVRGPSVRNWFRQDKGLLARLFSTEKLVPAGRVVSRLLELFPEVEAYWEKGTVGPHLEMFERGG